MNRQPPPDPAVAPPETAPAAPGRAKARYIMIGGFLGAGKTTAVAQLARHLAAQKLRVGLITNDQGSGLVDTTLLRSRGFATEEIAGGCFCCRFNSLMEAARKLTEAARPDVFIAEPVGSCTDLVATVAYPLRRLYGADFTISPLSVLLDPIRALRVLGLAAGNRLSEKVVYIYRKQIEEADLLVVNKSDALDSDQKDVLVRALEREFPGKPLFSISARHGHGLGEWFDRIVSTNQPNRPAIDLDYQIYAEGEARLGWLNATVQLSSPQPFSANDFLAALAAGIQNKLGLQNNEIAHLKMTFAPDSGLGNIAAVNLVRNDFVPELSQALEDPATSGQLVINLRAEGDPGLLGSVLIESLGGFGHPFAAVEAVLEHVENFRPGKPAPTHRFESPEAFPPALASPSQLAGHPNPC